MFTLALVGFALLLLGSFVYLAKRDAQTMPEDEDEDLTQ